MDSGLNKKSQRKLFFTLTVFVLALGVPAVVLVITSYQQLRFESLHQQRVLAEEMVDRIDQQLLNWIAEEEQRTVADYSFLLVRGDTLNNFLQPSPLSDIRPDASIPGLLGYFQVDAQGGFTSPILPELEQQAFGYGIDAQQLLERQQVHQQLFQILLDNNLLQARALQQEGQQEDQQESQQESRLDQVASLEQEAAFEQSPSQLGDSDLESSFDDEVSLSTIPQATPQVSSQATDVNMQEVEEEDLSSVALSSSKVSDVKNAKDTTAKSQRGFDQLFRLQKDGYERFNNSKAEKKNQELDLEEEITSKEIKVTASQITRDAYSEPKTRAVRKEKSPAPMTVIENDQGLLKQDGPGRAGEQLQVSNTSGGVTGSDIVNDSVSAVTQRSSNSTTITLFESEVEPMEFTRLDGGYWIFFRKVWREDQRIIQGGLIDSDIFIQNAFSSEFFSNSLSSTTQLQVFANGFLVNNFSPRDSRYRSVTDASTGSTLLEAGEELLFQRHLSVPFGNVELQFVNIELPLGPGGQVIAWSTLIMALVLLGGVYLLFRLGTRQLYLVQQQQDFVSAVSHELKTPLTSIRMYGEMLREGWADESKRQEYYDYIYDESERLSRLIANVLQLARMNRNELSLNIKSVSVGELLDNARSKLSQQIQAANFEFELQCAEDLRQQEVQADADSFMQVIINLVDNAIKFSKKSEIKKIQLNVTLKPVSGQGSGAVQFSVRDFGPGIAKPNLKKIFSLFYRAENELTRETVGTGIGLALVNQLVRSMGGSVDVLNCDPGAEFRVLLMLSDLTSSATLEKKG